MTAGRRKAECRNAAIPCLILLEQVSLPEVSAGRRRMNATGRLAQALLAHTDSDPGESPFMTAIDGLAILRSDHPKPPSHMISRPALCIVAQGAKWATFGGNRLEYRAGQALLIGVETPSIGRVVEASPGEPCLVLAFELDLAVMRSVANELDTPPLAREE